MEKIFAFLHKVEKLKSTLRYNQTSDGRTESSAEHSWRLSLMVFMFVEELQLEIDCNRAMKIAIVHDIAESITGDIDAVKISDGEISKEEKNKMEVGAMEKLRVTLPHKLGDDVYILWNEYEEGKTSEAKFVKALDKIETLTQLYEAGYEFYDRPEFIPNYADKAVKNFPELIDALMMVKQKLKSEYLKGNIDWKERYDNIE